MEKETKQEFKQKVFSPLMREITVTMIVFFLVGITVPIWKYFKGDPFNSEALFLTIIFLSFGMSFFVRRYFFEKGFLGKDSRGRFILDVALFYRMERLTFLQKFYKEKTKRKVKEKIKLINLWLEDEE